MNMIPLDELPFSKWTKSQQAEYVQSLKNDPLVPVNDADDCIYVPNIELLNAAWLDIKRIPLKDTVVLRNAIDRYLHLGGRCLGRWS